MKLRSMIDDKKKARVREAIVRGDPSLIFPKRKAGPEPAKAEKKELNLQQQIELNDKLWEAVKKGDMKAAEELISKGADIDDVISNGKTLLMQAAADGMTDILEMLITKGANVNATDRTRWTAIMWASQNCRFECIKILIDNGGDINAIDKHGRTALKQARLYTNFASADWLSKHGAKM